jgi:hypothetical protein
LSWLQDAVNWTTTGFFFPTPWAFTQKDPLDNGFRGTALQKHYLRYVLRRGPRQVVV